MPCASFIAFQLVSGKVQQSNFDNISRWFNGRVLQNATTWGDKQNKHKHEMTTSNKQIWHTKAAWISTFAYHIKFGRGDFDLIHNYSVSNGVIHLYFLHLHQFLHKHYVSSKIWELWTQISHMALFDYEDKKKQNKTCCTPLICPLMLCSCTSDFNLNNSQVLPGKLFYTHFDRAVLSDPLLQQSSLAYKHPDLLFPKQRMNEPGAFNVAVVFWQFETYQRSDWWCAPSRASCWQAWPALRWWAAGGWRWF